MGAGGQCRVADNCLRVDMRVVRISIHHTIAIKVAKAPFFKSVVVTQGQVSSKLINRYLQHELWLPETWRREDYRQRLAKAVRTLEYMKRFRTPRGAQTWEIPMPSADSA